MTKSAIRLWLSTRSLCIIIPMGEAKPRPRYRRISLSRALRCGVASSR